MARPQTRYVPSLDGLRALAVLAVIAYHMKMSWAPGGLLGVTMFFVLSGYLITGLLLAEYDASGTISLKGFWLRRVRRIVPAIVFAVLGTGMLCTIFDQALLTKMRPDVLPTLLFFNNWWQIFHNVSYFQALGEPSPLTHCWSLAIEEQFYLIWPIALLACMKVGVQRKTMQRGIIVLILLSALEMALLFNPAADPSRVYYGTDTRAFSLLIGALLAFVWPYQKLTERAGAAMSSGGRALFNAIGVAATVGLLLMVAFTNGFEPFIYRGGLVLCSLLTAVAIAVMVHPISLIGKLFALPPFVWIGKRSYSMYLWHYPLILLMTPNNLVGNAPWWLRLVQLAVIFAVSAFSYTFVENPIRHGAIGEFLADLSNRRTSLVGWASTHVITLVASVAVIGVALGGFAFVPDTSSVTNVAAMQAESTSGGTNGGEGSGGDDGQMAASEPVVEPYDMLLIGDSVPASLDGYGVFEKYFPTGHIDAIVGRQFYNAPEVYASYADAGYVGDVVPTQLDAFVQALNVSGACYNIGLATLGNIVGGAILVGMLYWCAYHKKAK